jgi:excisionase family DNA binding protein
LCSDRIIEEVTMPNRSAEPSLTLTVDEAAALIGVSRSTAYDLVATDELPTVRLRRRILVPASAFADLLGVSLVEVYGALSRLRGRTELKYGQRVGGSNGPAARRAADDAPVLRRRAAARVLTTAEARLVRTQEQLDRAREDAAPHLAEIDAVAGRLQSRAPSGTCRRPASVSGWTR